MSRIDRPRSAQTHLAIEKLLNGRQPLFPIYAYPDLLPFIVFLNSKDNGRYVKIAENRVYEMYLLRFGPYDV